jgi:two-component system nitrate/nitrite response regulator NarL
MSADMQTLVTPNQTADIRPGQDLVQPAPRRRVILADDDPLVRTAVRLILAHHRNFDIVGEAETGDEAIALAAQSRPDLLLLDLNMPKRPGLGALHDLRLAVPHMRTILLTVSIERRQILEALQAGARGVVLKAAARTVLPLAVEAVMKGLYWIDKKPVNDLSELLQQLRADSNNLGSQSHLTPREKQVVEFIVEGCTNKDIAKTLCTTEQVIKNYLGKIFDKLGVFNRLELALYALDHGLARRQ